MTRNWKWERWVALAAIGAACSDPVTLTTGLSGTVLRGPVTPVCQVSVPCEAPFAASFEVRQGGHRVVSFASNSDGLFSIGLAPGSYEIIPAASAPIISPASQIKTVVVDADGLTSVVLRFDTGIR